MRAMGSVLESESRWSAAWARVGAVPPAGLLEELLGAYAEPHRHYHTEQHLEECFKTLAPAAFLARHLGEIELALWFHDAIYDTQAHDNEAASAGWAETTLRSAGVEAAAVARVRDLVLATKHDAVPSDEDAKLLVDVDLSILGADPDRFDEYERQVRMEYAWVPEELFRPARRAVLASFLERPTIYGTRWFNERLEVGARGNLGRSLAALVDDV
jgi:predicted metal-dependent HD superfamily phosphohydrolase